MCTFKGEREVVVCDVAIGRVRERLESASPGKVRYAGVDEPLVDRAEEGRRRRHVRALHEHRRRGPGDPALVLLDERCLPDLPQARDEHVQVLPGERVRRPSELPQLAIPVEKLRHRPVLSTRT